VYQVLVDLLLEEDEAARQRAEAREY